MNELRELLARGAGDDPARFDADDVRRRFQRRRRVRAAAGSLVVLLALGVAVGLVVRANDDRVVTDDGQDDVSTNPADLFDRDWVAEQVEVDGVRWQPPAGFQLQVAFRPDYVTASACNGSGGAVTYGDGTMTIVPSEVSTAMQCLGPEGEAEGRMDAALPRAQRWRLRGDVLEVSGPGMRIVLHETLWNGARGSSSFEVLSKGSSPDGRQWEVGIERALDVNPNAAVTTRMGAGRYWSPTVPVDLPPSGEEAIPFLAQLVQYGEDLDDGALLFGRAPVEASEIRYETADGAERLTLHRAPNGWVVYAAPVSDAGGRLVALDAMGRELHRWNPFPLAIGM